MSATRILQIPLVPPATLHKSSHLHNRGISIFARSKNSKDISQFICSGCQKCFYDESALNKHQSSSPIHSIINRCRACSKKFGDRYGLFQHMVSPRHGISPWELVTFHCDQCGTSFPTYGDLKEHHLALHASPCQNPEVRPRRGEDMFAYFRD